MASRLARFSLGFNFTWPLVEGIERLNSRSSLGVIDEVFGALPDCPVSSARPTVRIPAISWAEFARQVWRLADAGISFNFLMNTGQECGASMIPIVVPYLRRLIKLGVQRVTVGTLELCRRVKDVSPQVHVTMSITYGIRTPERLLAAVAAGADAVYLDGVFVNRDFKLLRELIGMRAVECRLYANMSCISTCPVVGKHYAVFAGPQDAETARKSDAFFAGCSLVKLRNEVEWIQMPWIRPEDISAYVQEGIVHFKLADRLAATPVLLGIAAAYLDGRSPQDIFPLMERDAIKYRMVLADPAGVTLPPIVVDGSAIPEDFLEHFRSGACRSRDANCDYCGAIARQAVRIQANTGTARLPPQVAALIPQDLLRRVRPATGLGRAKSLVIG